MDNFLALLRRLSSFETLRNKWINQSKRWLTRALALSIAAIASAITSISAYVITHSYAFASLSATLSISLFAIIGLLIVNKIETDDDNKIFTMTARMRRKLIEKNFEEKTRVIKNLGLIKAKEERLILVEYKKMQVDLNKLDDDPNSIRRLKNLK